MGFLKKTNPWRSQMPKGSAAEQLLQISQLTNIHVFVSALIWLLFVGLCVSILSFELIQQTHYLGLIPITAIVLLISLAAAFYINSFQKRIIQNHIRTLALACLFISLLAATKLGVLLTNSTFWATGTAFITAVILMLAYNQRFAIGMCIFYCLFACLAVEQVPAISLFLIIAAGSITCCFTLKEIRTRTKLLEVSALSSVIVFVMAISLDFLTQNHPRLTDVSRNAGYHAAAVFSVGIIIQSLLPLIEKAFRITTDMTLLDYSDANKPLLKRLAIEAPGTFSHSFLVGSIAESAAEAIGRNGLLCRVGAYYHDIGKINKSTYFIENEIGFSRHKELSPAMSHLIIAGHVKDGIEIAREYGLPVVLWQFIETHHGTTLIEYFYNVAKKKYDEKQYELSESEFRYPGPKPRTKEAAIVMIADTTESASRALSEPTPTKIEVLVHNIVMKRLQDGQFDECDLSLRELSQIESSISRTLAAHYHSRIAYPEETHPSEGVQPHPEQAEPKSN
jgi:hypothetical protein